MSKLDKGLTAERLERFLRDARERIKNPKKESINIFSKCKKCGQPVIAPFFPVEECPMCTPEKFKK